MKEYYRRNDGEPLRVRILQNETQVWPTQDWAVVPVGDVLGLTHDLTLAVAQGDIIRFVLDKVAQPESAVLAWMPRIVYADDDTGGQAPAVSSGSSAAPSNRTPTDAETSGRPIRSARAADPSRRRRRSRASRPRRPTSRSIKQGVPVVSSPTRSPCLPGSTRCD